MYSVIGIVHRKGTFNDVSYDNYLLHCVRSSDPGREEQGQITEVFKVKSDLFLNSGVSIGDDISPMYDKFGRLVSL